MKGIMLLVLSVLLLTTVAHAELYSWIDDDGTVNFTEDYASIPQKFRKSARSTDDTVTTETATQGRSDAAPAGTSFPDATQNGKTAGSTAVLYDGKRGEVWGDELRQARAELKAYEDQIALKRKMLADTSTMGRREYLGHQNDVKEYELKIKELKARLSALEARADKVGVPAKFR